jgi:cytochrome c biogenesis protein CcmG/thiol:disulfide interchange protein DsbE
MGMNPSGARPAAHRLFSADGTLRLNLMMWKALIVLAVLGLLASGCGEDDAPRPRGVVSSPGALARQSSEILGGGEEAFATQRKALEGHPLVVNKWASWCGPCRFEFPFFRRLAKRLGDRIGFLGVNSRDSRKAAEDFLDEFPVPYPSFFDPKGKVARTFRGDRAFPTTAFYDRSGKLVFTKQGGYASESAVANDIAQYLR